MANKDADLSHWINEREAMRMRREHGTPAPWTTDPVMATVRFCNVHREDDKVTRYIRNNPTYSGPDVPVWVVVLSRMVNRIKTLELIEPYVKNSDLLAVKGALKIFRKLGPIWGNAYTISTCGKSMDKVDYVVDHVVQGVKDHDNEVWRANVDTCQCMFEWLTGIDGLGSFLAAQVVADLKNTIGHPLNKAPDWYKFSAPGPGSLRGLGVYFGQTITPRYYQQAISDCYAEVQPLIAPYVGDMHMQDFQNCLCEFSKYMRVKHGDGHARNTYVAR